MDLPDDAKKTGARPGWLGYVRVDDVDAAADQIERLGGSVHVPPTNVPNISRFSIFADPQSARLALFKWLRPGQEQPAEPGVPGRVGWHELLAADWEKALAFYGELFGWQKADADSRRDGHVSAVLRRRADDRRHGRTSPRRCRLPFWLYYFNVGDLDAAAQRVKAGGGQILDGPRRSAGRQLDRAVRGPAGRHIRAGGTARPQARRIFRARASRDPSDTRSRRWYW